MDRHAINFKLDNSYVNPKINNKINNKINQNDLYKINNLYFPDIKILTYKSNSNNFKDEDINEYILDIKGMRKLFSIKSKIDKYYNEGGWDIIKKRTNPYEMVYITNKKQRHQSVSKYEPLSRSYFKMIEISYEYLRDHLSKREAITTVHLAEGPGGFIEGIVNIRKNPNDRIYGMTLVSHNKEVPGWRRSWFFLSKHLNINILKGLDGTGNIYNLDNHIFMENRIGNKKAEIVTADGGFDFSVNYNQQEFLAQKLIFSQVVLGVSIQENGGSFIIKFFDTYSYISNQILFLLMTLYKSVYIFKPYTSRPANSERYIVCKGFYGISASRVGMLRETLHIWNTLPKHINMKSLFSGLPDKFLKDMKDLNNYIQKEQIQYIEATIYLMENNNNIGNNNIGNNKYKSYNEDQQIELAKLWCKKYGVPSI